MKESLSKKETPMIMERRHHWNHCSGSGLFRKPWQIWVSVLHVSCVIPQVPWDFILQRQCSTYVRRLWDWFLVPASWPLATKEFKPRGGSAPVTRFVIGMFVMIGCLMFLGCPFRMILRLAGGDWNAIFGLIGFIVGILAGVFFLKKGYTLKRSYKMQPVEGVIFPVVEIGILVLLIAAPAFIHFTEADGGPGAKHAAIAISLIAGLVVGALAQRTRLCMVGGIRDVVLFGEWKLLLGFVAILVSALIGNMILGYFHPGFAGQAIAHTDGLWNALGMALAGFGCVLLGGCPLRQLVLAGEGNTDSAITVFGLMAGAAVAHNFGLASSGEGPTANGKAAVIIGFVVLFVIAAVNSARKAES